MELVNMEELKKSCLGLKSMFICLANHHDFSCKDCVWDDFCHNNETRFTEEGEKELDRQRYKAIETILKALEEYEAYRTAEEQGLLLRLPCKVFDTVYELIHIARYAKKH